MNARTFAAAAFVILLAVIGIRVLGSGGAESGDGAVPTPMSLNAATPAPEAALASSVDQPDDVITVYKSPTCGCCGDWVTHMRENGFTVNVVEEPAMMVVKTALGLPDAMASCHTAVIGGELVEGHVPAETLRRYLADAQMRGSFDGLSVPGMPVGSPGMEVEGQPADAYDIVAFTTTGETATYESR